MRHESWEAWDRSWDQETIDANWADHAGRVDDRARLDIARRCVEAGADSLLDLGCGGAIQYGYMCHAAPGVRYGGVDSSRKMLAAAERWSPEAETRLADVANLPDAGRSWGMVLLRHVLEHQPLEKGERLLREAARLADHSVLLNLYVRTRRDGSTVRPRQEPEPPVVEGWDGPFYENSWSEPWVRGLMRELGFVADEPAVFGEDYLLDFRRMKDAA